MKIDQIDQTNKHSRLHAALLMAAKGRYVFPANEHKKPIIKDWPNNASVDEQILKGWFDKRNPPNLAVTTGHKSHVICVDLDGDLGKSNFKILQAEHGPVDDNLACIAQTPNGGLHYYFAMPELDIRNSASKLAAGIDIRANGGYVVVPPSSIINRKYVLGNYIWLSKITLFRGTLPPFPDWLLELLLNKPDPEPDPPLIANYTHGKSSAASPLTSPYGRKALSSETDSIKFAVEGTRNDTLNRSAFAVFRLVKGGEIDEHEAETALKNAALGCGLDEKEIAQTLASARVKAYSMPRTAPAKFESTKVNASIDPPAQVDKLTFLPDPPLEIFPYKIQKLLKEAALSFKRLPLEVPMVALLSLLAACVGRSRAVIVKEGWEETGNLYIGMVAGSGLGKSPCFKEFFKPVWKHEIKNKAKWDLEMERYNILLEERRLNKEVGHLAPPPEKPVRLQYIVEDITTEALGNILSENPRGLLWYCDELSSIILNLDRYSSSKGGTKARLLSTYDGSPWKTSRRRDSDKDQIIPSAILSIVGTVQPKVLKELFNQSDAFSGFLPRFIFILAKRQSPAVLENEVFTGQEILEKIATNILTWSMDIDQQSGPMPKKVRLTQEAYSEYVKWHNDNAIQVWKKSDVDQTISAKLVTQVVRLALLLHCLKAALTDGDGTNDISLATMQEAIKLGDWIQVHQKKIWIALNVDDTLVKSPLEKAIVLTCLMLEGHLEKNEWKITNEEFNACVTQIMKENIDKGQIGRVTTKMGIKNIFMGKKRGKNIPPALLKEFKFALYL